MKFKTLLLFCFFTILVTQGFSQDFYTGLRIGYGLAGVQTEGSPQFDLSRRPSTNIALVFNNRFKNSAFGFSIEPGYHLKGTRVDDSELDYRFNFLSTPVLLDLYPTDKIKISVGPEFSYLMSPKNRFNDTTKVDLTGTYTRKWEVAGTVGVSFALDYFVNFGLRYTKGFTDMVALDPALDTRNLRNESFQFFFLFKIAN
ncbi:porin family protein [Roseivirga sp.]|uniref:porin family protein n=1 Tax=Roseivirga sp. TaxID=1964215 RepID=UPI003B8E40D4